MPPTESDDKRRLLDVAEDIADGSSVDWDETTSGTNDPRERALLDKLHILEKLGSTFRDEASASTPADVGGTEPLFTWGQLEVLYRIGEGSFGEVYRAYDPALDRLVALKLQRKETSQSPIGRRRSLREARRLADLRHPNVLSVHGADEHDGRVGFWADLIEGRTLAELVVEQGPMSAEEAVAVGRVLCGAIAAVHGAGLVHGDVKPSNVMREHGGRLILMDFGAASPAPVEGGPEPAEEIQGTPATMAPEVLDGSAPTVSSDIYSVGVLLYFLLSGFYPVRAESLDELRVLHHERALTPLRDRRPELPQAIVDAVDRTLDPDPQARFASAGNMERALARAVDGVEKVPPRVPNMWLGRWSRMAAAAVVVAAFVVAWVFMVDDDSSTAVGGCISNQQCSDDHFGQPYVCAEPGGACVSLLTPDCTRVVGDWSREEAIFVGALYPMSGGRVGEAVADAQACGLDHAIDDLNQALGGLPGPGGSRRQFVAVMCDERGDIAAAVNHLADNVGVPAIFGTIEHESTMAAMDALAAKDVLMMSTHLATPPLEVLDDGRLHWSVLPNDTLSVRALDGYLDRFETEIRARPGHPERLRVALVTGESGVDTTIGDFIVNNEILTFNDGAGAAANAAASDPVWCPTGCFRRFSYGEMAPAQLPIDLADYAPHVIVVQNGTTAFSAAGMPAFEERLAQIDPGGAKPIYLYHFPDPTPLQYAAGALDGTVVTDPHIAGRLYANLKEAEASPLLESFWVNFGGRCPDSVPPRSPVRPPNQWNTYDAFFLVAFAHLADGNHALASSDIGGARLSSGLSALAPAGHAGTDAATRVPLSQPLSWQRAVNLLLQGQEVDLEGVAGDPLDFDVDTGFPGADYQLGCPSPDLTRWQASGVRWSHETGRVTGEIARCSQPEGDGVIARIPN